MDKSLSVKLRLVIQQRLDDPQLGVDDLCSAVHLSRSQLHRRLKKETGKSATHFIREIRLQHAKHLLKQKKISVTETAMETGFTDPAFFSRVFKNRFGVPPSKIGEEE